MPQSMSYVSIQYTKVRRVQSFVDKVDVPNLGTYLKRTPIFEWYVGLVWLQERIPRRHCVFERVWTMCSKYANHSKPSSQHNWGDLNNPLNEHENLYFDNGKRCSYELHKP